MEYKDTLLMPNTKFSMKGNLAENEKITRAKWEEMDLYNKILEKNKEGIPFILHDGPPYANGNIHIGHAMNKILKDFINRNKMLEGYKVTYIPGWDTHGLPIETAVAKSGVDRKIIPTSVFRSKCLEYAKGQIEKQMQDFKNLNVIADWENYYATYQTGFEAKQIELFAKLVAKDLIYKGLKPVYWSPSSESALAEAEIEYKDKKDPSVFVSFEITKGNEIVNKGDNLIIWTTTPWSLPGNLAIAVGEYKYSLITSNNKNYIIATDLVEELTQEFEFEDYEIIKKFDGKEICDITYKHPFINRTSKVVMGHHVTLDAGTGLVHIAPSYGVDDFQIGKKYNLGMVNGVDDKGYLTEESGKFQGIFYDDANKEIVKDLEETNNLVKLKFITHSYPHDWRTKKPVIYRATAQWFCSIDKIRNEILNQLDTEVKFHTPWGKTRLYNMIKDRTDWCISRQRAWGIPIPIFYNEDGSEIIDYNIIMNVAKLFKEYGSNIWFEWDPIKLLPEGYKNPKSPNSKFTIETDIMDVWFDSGSTFNGVLVNRGYDFQADLYLEGSDQYRGWFNSSLINGVASYGKAPYKQLVSHGFTLDGKGNKMSKSIGNVIDPNKLIRLHGSDILRLWVASTDFREDVRISDEVITQVKESYRKIRNTYRFILGNLFDFKPENSITYENLFIYDKYAYNKLKELQVNTKKAYENYNFQEVYKLVNNYIFNLSNFYLDFTKDILYIEKANSQARRSVQTVLYEIVINLSKLLAPILPYTSEEVYSYLNLKESIFLENNEKIEEFEIEDEQLWDTFFKVKDDVYKALEEARNAKIIGKSLEAKVYIKIEDKKFISTFAKYIKQLLIVSEVEITNDKYEVKVEGSKGIKCERCWNLFDEKSMQGEICNRCHEITKI